MKKGLLLLTLILLASVLIYGASGCSKQYSQGGEQQGQDQSSTGVGTGEGGEGNQNQQTGGTNGGTSTSAGTSGSSENTIEITSAGFTPNRLTINVGDRVTFINKDAKGHWPASNDHPTHTKYPGSSVGKCGTDEASGIFDACKALQQEESWSFTFTQKGVWGYHDHRASSLSGTIEVA